MEGRSMMGAASGSKAMSCQYDQPEEFDEDLSCAIQDLSQVSDRFIASTCTKLAMT